QLFGGRCKGETGVGHCGSSPASIFLGTGRCGLHDIRRGRRTPTSATPPSPCVTPPPPRHPGEGRGPEDLREARRARRHRLDADRAGITGTAVCLILPPA